MFTGWLSSFCALKKQIDSDGYVEVLYRLPEGIVIYDNEAGVWYANADWIKRNFDRNKSGDVEFLKSMGIKP